MSPLIPQEVPDHCICVTISPTRSAWSLHLCHR